MTTVSATFPGNIRTGSLITNKYALLFTGKHIKRRMAMFFTVCLLLITAYSKAQTISQTYNYSGPKVFGFTGAVQTYTVPAGISSITVDIAGGSGGSAGGTPGKGGRVQATIAVTAGTTLNIYVGGLNNVFNGGGDAYYSNCYGGGGTDIRVGGTALGNRIIVAGGGGGTSDITRGDGGDGGQNGGSGTGEDPYAGGTNASGGTQIAGGAAGDDGGGDVGTAGTLGQGGTGGSGNDGGGGGGGYYGGGGGGSAGGGGGSSYAGAGCSNITYTAGYKYGAGYVVITTANDTLYKPFTVPAGVSSISVDMAGAQGGSIDVSRPGGLGGRVQATLAVTAGTVLYFCAGSAGLQGGTPSNTDNAGYNGGGGANRALSGGDASDIRAGGTALANRVLVAGGGGGRGYGSYAPGAGGATTGASATGDNPSATGGTPAAGGAAGGNYGYTGLAGSLGMGGSGNMSSFGSGGGGGGGYYGGGGGGLEGGGGGSSYAGTGTGSVTHTQGYQTGNGYITISYTPPPVYYSAATGNLNVAATWWTNPDGTGTNPSAVAGLAGADFHIANGNPGNLATATTLGAGSRFVFDNAGTLAGSTNDTLSGSALTGLIAVGASITLTISSVANGIILDSVAPTSTIVYNINVGENIPGGTYGNLVIGNPVSGSAGFKILKADATVAGNITLNQTSIGGSLNLSTFTLNIQGNIISGAGTPAFNYITVTPGTNGIINFNGSNAQTVDSLCLYANSVTLGRLTINNSAGVTLRGGAAVLAAITLTTGTLHATGLFVTRGTISRTNGNIDLSSATLNINGTTVVPAGTISPDTVKKINLVSGAVTIADAITVTGVLTLTAGTLAVTGGLTLSTGASLTLGAGSLTAAPTYGTGVNVNCSGNVNSGYEITPASGSVGILSITGGTYSLVTSPVLAGLAIASGSVLNAAANSITAGASGVSVTGTFTHANTTGFTGGAATAIRNTNSPVVTLNPGSTISYTAVNAPVDGRTDYTNLTLTHAGVLSGNATVSGLLTLSGVLIVGSNTLSIGNFSGTAANALSVLPAGTITTTGALTGSLFFAATNDTLGTLNVGGNATLGNALNMAAGSNAGTVNITTGTLTTGGNLTLMSDANGTARIAQITGTGVSGSVNIQRFVPGQRGYRLLGHPYTTNQDLTTLGTYFDITGVTGLSNNCSGTNPSVFSYTPGALPIYTGITTAAGTFPTAHNTTGSQPNGILAFVRGAPGQDCLTSGTTPPSDLAFVTTGTVNAGNITETVPAHGWNLIANPYPSQVDLSRVAGISSLNALKIINPAQQNGEHTYTNGTAYTDLGTTAILPINGAFLAQNGSNADVTITFTEASKTGTAPVANTFKTTGIYPTLQLAVYNGSNFWDNWSLHMKPQAANIAGDDGDLDKISNAQFDIYSLSTDNLHLNMDARDADSIADGAIIPMGIRSVPQTTYTLQVNENSLPANKTVYLHDKYTGTYTELTNGTNYSFNVDANTATQGENRMELLFNNVTTGMNNVTNTQNHVQVVPNPATGNITLSYPPVFAGAKEINIVNAIGQVVRTVSSSDRIVTVDITGLATGVYVVKTTGNGGVVTGRFIKK